MPQYLLSVMQPEGGEPPTPDELDRIMADVERVGQAMKDAGAWVFAGGLHDPGTATVLVPKAGEVLVTDGPFIEAKEYLGGLNIVTAPDLDAALDWGRRLASATTLPIEVRPFIDEAAT